MASTWRYSTNNQHEIHKGHYPCRRCLIINPFYYHNKPPIKQNNVTLLLLRAINLFFHYVPVFTLSLNTFHLVKYISLEPTSSLSFSLSLSLSLQSLSSSLSFSYNRRNNKTGTHAWSAENHACKCHCS